MRVEVRGKVYKSVDECARKLGVSKVTVYSALSKGTEQTLGIGSGNGRRRLAGGRPAKPVVLAGIEFPSMQAASRALGRSNRYVHQVLTNGGERSRNNLLLSAMHYASKLRREQWEERQSKKDNDK